MNDEKPNQLIDQRKKFNALLESDRVREQVAKVLPSHITAERLLRVAMTASLKNPQLLQCPAESIMQAIMTCAQAGLEPDGRLAHLIPYNTKEGFRVQVIFDFKGLIALALRNGIECVYADKVCENDSFEAGVVDGAKVIKHDINWRRGRGEPYAYYCVTRKGNIVDFEVMTKDEVEAIRSRSKAKDSGPWKTDYDEMAKKTVVRRMSKRWDMLPEIRDAIYADDDTPEPIEIQTTTTRPIFGSARQLANSGNAESESFESAAALVPPAAEYMPQPEELSPEEAEAIVKSEMGGK